MQNLIIAYVLIAVVLIGYGVNLYRNTQKVERRIRELQEDN